MSERRSQSPSTNEHDQPWIGTIENLELTEVEEAERQAAVTWLKDAVSLYEAELEACGVINEAYEAEWEAKFHKGEDHVRNEAEVEANSKVWEISHVLEGEEPQYEGGLEDQLELMQTGRYTSDGALYELNGGDGTGWISPGREGFINIIHNWATMQQDREAALAQNQPDPIRVQMQERFDT